MKKRLFLLVITNCTLLILNAQSQFQRAIGGTNIDLAYSIIQTTDGGYAVAGYTNSFGAGSNDIYLVKFDGSGTLQWSKTIGGTGSEYGFSIIQTTDSGYAVAGTSSSYGAGNGDMYIVKLDASGTLQWSRTVGGTGYDYANSIIQTTDGGYAVAGYTLSFGVTLPDCYIVKLDASGTLQWSKTIGGTSGDWATSIIQTTDGGFVLGGDTFSFGGFFIVKLDSSGTLQWSKTISGDSYVKSILQTTDGGYALGGYTSSFGAGSNDFYIVKLDASGSLQWSRTVGGTGSDYGRCMIRTTDGGYAMSGETNSFGAGGYDMYIVKLDGSGTLQWSKTVGGSANERCYSIVQTTDGCYAGAGWMASFGAGNYDFGIVKFDGTGNTCGNSSSPSSASGSGGTLVTPTPTATTPTSTVDSPTPTIISVGTVTAICTLVGIPPISNEVPSAFSLGQNYPNPFNPSSKIKYQIAKTGFVTLKIYNALGKELVVLVNEQLNPGNYEITYDGSNLPSGVYYYKLSINGFNDTKRMVLIK